MRTAPSPPAPIGVNLEVGEGLAPSRVGGGFEGINGTFPPSREGASPSPTEEKVPAPATRLRRLRCGALLALVLTVAPLAAQEKSLHWAEVAVRAHLDGEGTLHVAERQTMVFTGDWNGGYRTFRLGIGQRVHLERLLRLDPQTGQAVPLVEGNIDEVDHYAWKDSKTLRWRSRLPSDPPFRDTALVYEIDYTLSGILWASGGLYHLNHNFVFPDREGAIERFALDLDLDPVWQPVTAVPSHLEVHDLPPGVDEIVRADLAFHGAAPPPGIRSSPPTGLRGAFFLAALVAMAWLYFRFRDHEVSLGRWTPPPVPPSPEEEWLKENVLAYLPEEVGALWDRKVGPPEVAATLARLVGEGKLASEVVPARSLLHLIKMGRDVLRLRRVAAPSAFDGYEKKLVDRLFFSGRTEVDTDEIRAHYKSTGFDPAQVIRKDLEARLAHHPELKGKTPAPSRKPTVFLCLAAGLLLLIDGFPFFWDRTLILALIVPALCLAFYVPGLIAAFSWRERTERLDLGSLRFLLPGLGIFVICLVAAFFPDLFPQAGGFLIPGFFGSLALALIPVAALNSLLNNARSRETAETIRRRQTLAAARHWFQGELRRPVPALRDEWFPYLLAFGLNADVDRWFHAFGGKTAGAVSTFSGSSSSFGGSSSGTGGWTGGGGAFGGAGATGTWAAAATGLAAGVAAPSSSGGSGGGGGGGSSGGGGGGGW